MPKRYGYSITFAAMMALMVGFAFQADAELLVYDSRDAWQSALVHGADLQYNFNSFTSDASFATGAINFGGFQLSAIGALPPPGSDMIHGDSALDQGLDGTPYASMFLDATRSVALDFTRPALAFGADFAGGLINFGVFLSGRQTAIVGGPGPEQQFFGIISTDPISRIDFLYSGPPNENTTVRFDSVAGASAVPEPSSLMMLGMGAVTFVAYSCFRLRRGKTEPGPDRA